MKIKNVVEHFCTITKHRWVVFKLCTKVGEPWRGLVHDLSKYSPTEFWEGVRYFNGHHSPITDCKKDKGYSEAWLHHKGRNKHHADYWIDMSAPEKYPLIPYQYVAEMICDKLAAGIIYQGKDWTKEYEFKYWERERVNYPLNENVKKVITEVLEQVSKNGIDSTLTKKNIKSLYKKYCIDQIEINEKMLEK